MTRGLKIVVKCQNCKEQFEARVADRKRGWAKFCSKSCKAKKQEAIGGQFANYLCGSFGKGVSYRGSDDDDQSWDAHKH